MPELPDVVVCGIRRLSWRTRPPAFITAWQFTKPAAVAGSASGSSPPSAAVLPDMPDRHSRVEMTWLALLHLGLHAAVPGGIALLFFRPNWKRAWLIMISTMMVDLDHLLADPIYDPARCGIGFHPLHTYPAIAAYAVLLVPRVTRLMGLGLVIHMALDALDCVWK